MKVKLTLTMDESVIKEAKKYAQKKNRSLSTLIENYPKALSKDEALQKEELSPLIKSLKGSFKFPENFNYKKELTNGLSEKHLKKIKA